MQNLKAIFTLLDVKTALAALALVLVALAYSFYLGYDYRQTLLDAEIARKQKRDTKVIRQIEDDYYDLKQSLPSSSLPAGPAVSRAIDRVPDRAPSW